MKKSLFLTGSLVLVFKTPDITTKFGTVSVPHASVGGGRPLVLPGDGGLIYHVGNETLS